MLSWILWSYGFSTRDLEDDFNKYSKEEFKEYAGSLKYAEYRCEQIYKRLEEIGEEASRLDN